MSRYKSHSIHKYPEEALTDALRAIREETLSIREASRRYGVPRGTLQDRIHGRVLEGPRKMGPGTVLTKEEEGALENWLISLAKCGFPQKKDDLLHTVEQIMRSEKRKTPFKDQRPGKKWYAGFLKRHPALALREAEGLTKGRSIITEEFIRKWFRDLEVYLEENNWLDIMKDPSRIMNGDETSFSMCPKTGKVLAPKGYKNVYDVKKGNDKETITVLIICSADGNTLPPMVVFPFVRPNKAIVDSMPSTWFLGRSDSGWMRTDIFFEYIANGLNRYLEESKIVKPVILFVDGHKSHLSLELSQYCHDNGIILYALPPNTTHIMQPADVSVFKPLKSNWKKTVRAWQAKPENVNSVLTKCTFCPLLQKVLSDYSLVEANRNGFRKCGLFPFNPDAVDYSKCIQNAIERVQQTTNNNNELISQEQIETTKLVLKQFKHMFTEGGQTNVDNILQKLETINAENYPIPEEDYQAQVNGILVDAFVMPDGTLQRCDTQKADITEKQQTPTRNVLIFDFDIEENIENEIEDYAMGCSNIISTIALVHGDKTREYRKEFELLETEMYNKNEFTKKKSNFAEDPTNHRVAILNKQQEDMNKIEVIESEVDVEEERKEEDDGDIRNDIEDPYKNSEKKIRVLQDITLETSNNTSLSQSFSTHLYFPTPIKNKTSKQTRKDRLPAAISSFEFRKILQEKIDEKKKVEDEREKRKADRLKRSSEQKRCNPKGRKKQKKQKIETDVNSLPDSVMEKEFESVIDVNDKEIRNKEKCATCTLDMDSDTEDNDLKNIGCDRCLRWFHLKCSPFQGCDYFEIEYADFTCDFCKK